MKSHSHAIWCVIAGMRLASNVFLRSRAAVLPIVAALVLAGSAAAGQCAQSSILGSVDTPDLAFGVVVADGVAYVADRSPSR